MDEDERQRLVARALASPEIMAMVKRIADENAGLVEPPRVLTDEEVRELMPNLRPPWVPASPPPEQ
jgi:hypothetical protein